MSVPLLDTVRQQAQALAALGVQCEVLRIELEAAHQDLARERELSASQFAEKVDMQSRLDRCMCPANMVGQSDSYEDGDDE